AILRSARVRRARGARTRTGSARMVQSISRAAACEPRRRCTIARVAYRSAGHSSLWPPGVDGSERPGGRGSHRSRHRRRYQALRYRRDSRGRLLLSLSRDRPVGPHDSLPRRFGVQSLPARRRHDVTQRLAPQQRRRSRATTRRREPRGEAVGPFRDQPIRNLAAGISIVGARARLVRGNLRRLAEVAEQRLGGLSRTAVVLASRQTAAGLLATARVVGLAEHLPATHLGWSQRRTRKGYGAPWTRVA